MYAYITICGIHYHVLLRYSIVLASTALYEFLSLQGSHPHEYYLYPL